MARVKADWTELAKALHRLTAGRVTLTLPWCPSVNHYYRHVGHKVLISAAGRKYRQDVAAVCLVNRAPRIEGRLRVDIEAYPPDRRVFDLDNRLKPLLDSIQHAGIVENDEQIDDLRIWRRAPEKPGRVVVTIAKMESR